MQAALEVHMKAFIDTELENEHAREVILLQNKSTIKFK